MIVNSSSRNNFFRKIFLRYFNISDVKIVVTVVFIFIRRVIYIFACTYIVRGIIKSKGD